MSHKQIEIMKSTDILSYAPYYLEYLLEVNASDLPDKDQVFETEINTEEYRLAQLQEEVLQLKTALGEEKASLKNLSKLICCTITPSHGTGYGNQKSDDFRPTNTWSASQRYWYDRQKSDEATESILRAIVCQDFAEKLRRLFSQKDNALFLFKLSQDNLEQKVTTLEEEIAKIGSREEVNEKIKNRCNVLLKYLHSK
jgi:hypothetical protein